MPLTRIDIHTCAFSFCFQKDDDKTTSQDIDDLLMGMASQIAEREDNVVVEDLRGDKSS